ncbi:NepR family anti-sigma factor [Humitalea sp. 24SJ18S-53]|uniref:NepR family anti-sigma factor n=1 Tax=Humitalea sp. 24SJ18S-53 TaxID=3422307 RepID=UPI003D665437
MDSRNTRPPVRARVSASDAAFDLWLQRGLHAMYDEVAKEPVPPELLALIERDRGKS